MLVLFTHCSKIAFTIARTKSSQPAQQFTAQAKSWVYTPKCYFALSHCKKFPRYFITASLVCTDCVSPGSWHTELPNGFSILCWDVGLLLNRGKSAKYWITSATFLSTWDFLWKVPNQLLCRPESAYLMRSDKITTWRVTDGKALPSSPASTGKWTVFCSDLLPRRLNIWWI